MREGKPVILYVEDDKDYRDMLRAILEAAGFEMVGAESGEDGLRAFRHERPDAVIVDLMMEEIDAGASLITELRAAGATDLPIYMLSSIGADLAFNIDTRDLGLEGVFQKPIDGDRLVEVLRARLGSTP